MYLNKKKWYYKLLENGLFSEHSRSSLLNKFVVCWDTYDDQTKKSVKLFSFFETHLDFVKYFINLDQNLRSFYEIVFGEKIQKPHFDVDMELIEGENTDKKVLNDLLKQIIALIPGINIEKDICIYTSHGVKKIKEIDGKQINNLTLYKKSYHVIINHYYHANNKEAKAFYYTIMSKLPKEYLDNHWIDHAVYSKTQQFRTYMSRKIKTNRTKEFLETWELDGKQIKHIYDEDIEKENDIIKFRIRFEESIINARISNCKPLPSFETPGEYVKKTFEKGQDLDYDMAIDAINLLAESIGTTRDNPNFPFIFDKVDGSFVILKRIKPSKCKMCNRIHENENPYLLIALDTKNVFFHCRRTHANRKLYIGCLKTEEEIEEDKNNEKKSGEKFEEEFSKIGKKEEKKEENIPVKMKPFDIIEVGSSNSSSNSNNNNKKNEDNKQNAKIWTDMKLNKLREIASSSNPKKVKMEKVYNSGLVTNKMRNNTSFLL